MRFAAPTVARTIVKLLRVHRASQMVAVMGIGRPAGDCVTLCTGVEHIALGSAHIGASSGPGVGAHGPATTLVLPT